MKQFSVVPGEAGQRVDIFVAKQYPLFTRSSLEALFDQELVLINHKIAKASQKIKDGDAVSVDETLLKTEPPKIDLPILYEDDDVIVIDKPAGVLTHSKGALNTEATVASFIKPKITDAKLTGNRAGVVHRLDRHTSGVIIAAKTEKALKHLQKQFSQRKTKKTYVAVVEGDLEPAEAIIDAPIQRNPKRPQTFRVDVSGKPAITRYKKLKTFQKANQVYSLVELRPETGRTHQLRVHLAYIKHPIVGDNVYGRGGSDMLLHAEALELTLPGGRRSVFRSELPARIKEFIDV